MARTDDYYRVLGVARDAGTPEIRRAYRRLARQHHPDRNPEPDGPERFRTLAEAYAVLNDPARRARYDHITQRPARQNPPRVTPAVLTRRGLLELSPREAQLAATVPLALTSTTREKLDTTRLRSITGITSKTHLGSPHRRFAWH